MFSLYIAAINKNIPKNCMKIILPGKIITALKNRKAMTKIVISFLNSYKFKKATLFVVSTVISNEFNEAEKRFYSNKVYILVTKSWSFLFIVGIIDPVGTLTLNIRNLFINNVNTIAVPIGSTHSFIALIIVLFISRSPFV